MHIFEKEADWYAQETGDREEAARTDAVNPFFVFLDLLEGEVEGLGEVSLRMPEHNAPESDALSDMGVYGVGFFFAGHGNSLT
jgi:hypothetical protein